MRGAGPAGARDLASAQGSAGPQRVTLTRGVRDRCRARQGRPRVMGQLVGDISAWAGNVSTSVAIVFVNKILMNATGYGFKYGARRVPWYYLRFERTPTLQILNAASSLCMPSEQAESCVATSRTLRAR